MFQSQEVLKLETGLKMIKNSQLKKMNSLSKGHLYYFDPLHRYQSPILENLRSSLQLHNKTKHRKRDELN